MKYLYLSSRVVIQGSSQQIVNNATYEGLTGIIQVIVELRMKGCVKSYESVCSNINGGKQSTSAVNLAACGGDY